MSTNVVSTTALVAMHVKKLRASVACCSETCYPETCIRLASCAVLKKKCAILKHASDWCCANIVISRADNNVFLTHCIWSSPKFITKKTNKSSSLVSLLVSLHYSFYASGPCILITCGFNMTKFAQCQFEACFRMAHILERHIMPIWNMFQNDTCFRMACNTHRSLQ